MNALLKLKRYMRPYKLEISVGILTVVLPVLMELLIPRLLQAVIDDGIRLQDMDAISQGAFFMILAAMVSAVSRLLGTGAAFTSAPLSRSTRPTSV